MNKMVEMWWRSANEYVKEGNWSQKFVLSASTAPHTVLIG